MYESQAHQRNRFPSMIFFTATESHPEYTVRGHIGEKGLTDIVNRGYNAIVRVQADGDELWRCHQILGRAPNRGFYIFLGDNAREIAANWYP